MYWYWKVLLFASLGGYWLFRKSKKNKTKETPEPPEVEKNKKDEGNSTESQIRRLTEVDGVTSRVAKNLIKRGIYTPEALKGLSEEELRSIKGIGPKRMEKILNSR